MISAVIQRDQQKNGAPKSMHWITPNKPQSVITSFYRPIDHELNRQIIAYFV